MALIWKVVALRNALLSLLLGCGFTIPTGFPNLPTTTSTGSVKSESLETMTASSKSSSKQSTSRCVAIFTSVRFSSVLRTASVSGPSCSGRYVSGSRGNLAGRVTNRPKWIVRLGTVFSARR